jgi:hypothetical protein
LSIKIGTKKKADEIKFISLLKRDFEISDSVRKAFVDQQKWILYEYVHVSNDNEIPRIRFTSYASRQVNYKIIKKICILYLMILITLASVLLLERILFDILDKYLFIKYIFNRRETHS